LMTTPCCSNSCSRPGSGNDGIRVSNLVEVFWPSPVGGQVTAVRATPWIASPRVVISETFPFCTWSLNAVYGIVTRSPPSGMTIGATK
jgi:hypothetical protein